MYKHTGHTQLQVTKVKVELKQGNVWISWVFPCCTDGPETLPTGLVVGQIMLLCVAASMSMSRLVPLSLHCPMNVPYSISRMNYFNICNICTAHGNSNCFHVFFSDCLYFADKLWISL